MILMPLNNPAITPIDDFILQRKFIERYLVTLAYGRKVHAFPECLARIFLDVAGELCGNAPLLSRVTVDILQQAFAHTATAVGGQNIEVVVFDVFSDIELCLDPEADDTDWPIVVKGDGTLVALLHHFGEQAKKLLSGIGGVKINKDGENGRYLVQRDQFDRERCIFHDIMITLFRHKNIT